MRRFLLAVLMTPLLLLSACSGRGKDDAMQAPMDFRTALLLHGGCSFTVQLRVDVQERLYDFSLACHGADDGSTEITVLAPETIGGIRATIRGETGDLIYDDLSLEFGLLEDTMLAPIELPAVLVACWESAYIESAGSDEGLLHVCYDGDYFGTPLRLDTWFEGGVPVRAELSLQGKVAAVMKLTDFSFDGG